MEKAFRLPSSDRDIMPLLGAPIGAAYERNEAGDLVAASPPEATE